MHVRSVIETHLSSQAKAPALDATLCDQHGITALAMASYCGWETIVELLLSYSKRQVKIDPNAMCSSGFSPLHYACWVRL